MAAARCIATRLYCALFCMFLAEVATATVAPPISIRWSNDLPPTAQAGRELTGSFEIVAGIDGELYDIELSGDGWVTDIVNSTAFSLQKNGAQRLQFRATPSDPTAVLEFRATFEGFPIFKTLRLDAASQAKASRPGALRYRDAAGPKLRGARSKDQSLHFVGRVMYTRSDSVVLGADSVFIRIMDEDTLDSEEIWSGATDSQGNFDVSLNWDDCDILGCDDPDIYVIVQTNGPMTYLTNDDVFPVLYQWETSVIDDFTGNEIDFGIMLPDDPNTDGALQVYTSIVRAARVAINEGGMTAPLIEARWPDPGTGSFYDGLALHIGSGGTWDESTIHHEYGHHLSNTFAALFPPNYNNGFCDTPNPGHCVWCPENVVDAWQEGWPDWFGGYVSRQYLPLYNVIPLSISNTNYILETPLLCGQDGQSYPNAMTEGYVGALLRDIEDATNDDHDGGAVDCDIDALTLGTSQIFTVFRDDDPTTVAQFITSFRARYPQFDAGLWSTTRNVATAFGFATPAPVVTSQPQACANYRYGDTIQLSVTGNGPNLQYQWRKNGTLLGGATTATLSLGPLTPGMTGSYTCDVSSCDGTLTVTSVASKVRVFGGQGAGMVAWGENFYGQVGVGNYDTPLLPAAIATMPDLIAAEGCRSAMTGIRANGDVYTWGFQQYGELGNNFAVASVNVPTKLSGISNAVAVAGGASVHQIVLLADGTAVGYGYNFYGQIGSGTQTNAYVPTAALLPVCVTDIAVGWYFSLFLGADGLVYASGDNDSGQLGNGNFGGWTLLPTPVIGLDNVVAIAAAAQSCLALKSDGTVWGWGANNAGQLGNGTTTYSALPVQTSGLANVTSIAMGRWNGFAVKAAGSAWSWGSNGSGQLGDGSFIGAYRYTPGTIEGVVSPVRIRAIESDTILAALPDGTLKVWGLNGNLGFGAALPVSSHSPISVPGLSDVRGIGGSYATLVAFGQLGSVVAVEEPLPSGLPTVLSMRSHPNPFAGRTSIALAMPTAGHASVRIYDVAGRLVRVLLEAEEPVGLLTIHWDGRDDAGKAIAAGVYFARLRVGAKTVNTKLLRLK